jgi:hypothetical protein
MVVSSHTALNKISASGVKELDDFIAQMLDPSIIKPVGLHFVVKDKIFMGNAHGALCPIRLLLQDSGRETSGSSSCAIGGRQEEEVAGVVETDGTRPCCCCQEAGLTQSATNISNKSSSSSSASTSVEGRGVLLQMLLEEERSLGMWSWSSSAISLSAKISSSTLGEVMVLVPASEPRPRAVESFIDP